MSIDTYLIDALRRECRLARNLLSQMQQQANAQAIQQRLTTCLPWKKLNIALFLAFDGEVNIAPFATTLRDMGASCFLPVLQPDKTLRFAPWLVDTQFIENRYGIAEPLVTASQSVEDLDVILMPLVAVDFSGHRVGMGGGYYDRTLALCGNNKPYLIGVAHHCQQVETILPQPWDIPLDMLVTEQNVTVWHSFQHKEST